MLNEKDRLACRSLVIMSPRRLAREQVLALEVIGERYAVRLSVLQRSALLIDGGRLRVRHGCLGVLVGQAKAAALGGLGLAPFDVGHIRALGDDGLALRGALEDDVV